MHLEIFFPRQNLTQLLPLSDFQSPHQISVLFFNWFEKLPGKWNLVTQKEIIAVLCTVLANPLTYSL
jgi:hypothetical protein